MHALLASTPTTSDPDHGFGALRDLRILVVDDDPVVVKLVFSMLADFTNLRFALSANDALRLIDAQRPDLILLDGEMPSLSGFDLCRMLKNEPATRDIPIIFVTSHDDVAFESHALALGAADFIPKPISRARLRLRIKLHLQLKHQLDQLRELATVDANTGLYNRRKLDETLASEWKRALRTGVPLSLVLIDVDHFKAYNDHYGHAAGDQCLREVAAAIRAAARRTYDVAARFGGEEFAIILPHSDHAAAGIVAERVRENLAAAALPHRASSVSDRVTVSIGVATVQTTDRAPDSELRIVESADRALYAAKRQGRDRVVHAETVVV